MISFRYLPKRSVTLAWVLSLVTVRAPLLSLSELCMVSPAVLSDTALSLLISCMDLDSYPHAIIVTS